MHLWGGDADADLFGSLRPVRIRGDDLVQAACLNTFGFQLHSWDRGAHQQLAILVPSVADGSRPRHLNGESQHVACFESDRLDGLLREDRQSGNCTSASRETVVPTALVASTVYAPLSATCSPLILSSAVFDPLTVREVEA